MHLSKKNVLVLLKGGLGNQLFQYATGKSLALRLGVGLTLDLNWYLENGENHTKFLLDKFQIDDKFFRPPLIIPRRFRSFIYKIVEKASFFGLTNPVLRDVNLKFTKELLIIDYPVTLDGYWQNELYFNQYRKEIIQTIKLREEIPYENQLLLNKIHNSNSICVHIRRGDYISNSYAANIHGICSIDYYYKAIDIFSKKIDSPSFYIFSDDPEWVKSNINIDHHSFVINSDFNKPELDFTLMKSCKHFIIANSTYSWWAAWLSTHQMKEVIAPKQWFLNKELNKNVYLNKNWIIL